MLVQRVASKQTLHNDTVFTTSSQIKEKRCHTGDPRTAGGNVPVFPTQFLVSHACTAFPILHRAEAICFLAVGTHNPPPTPPFWDPASARNHHPL
eukprot:m.368234 g.368234  ORF g.368234 m.368234 type:complete len:95 (+) comp28109_c1_seq12:68-352(+)